MTNEQPAGMGEVEEGQQPLQVPQPPMYAPPIQQTPPAGYPPQPNPSEQTNTLAIIALISSFFISVLGIVLGHIALSQIKKTGEQGRGLALAGTIIGYVITAFGAIALVFTLLSSLLFFGLMSALISDTTQPLEGVEEFDDSFADNLFSDDEYDDYAYDEPWVGTEHEEYCDMFMNIELRVDDPVHHAEKLGELTLDPESAKVWKKYAESTEDPNKFNSQESATLIDQISEIEDESFSLCYDD